MKLSTIFPHLKKIQKLYKSHDTSLEVCWHQQIFIISGNTDNYIIFIYIFSNFFDFYWVFEGCFIQQHCSFDEVNKIGYCRPHGNKGILKKRLWAHNFCPWRHQKNLPRDSNNVVDVVMWPKFGIFNLYMRDVIITKDLTRKTDFLRGGFGSSTIIWDWY